MIKVYEHNRAFLSDFLTLLKQDEIKNNLMIGISKRDQLESPFFISSMIDNDWLVGVIAGKNMILASNTQKHELYEELILFMENKEYPGIIGPKDVCETYVNLYQSLTHKQMIKYMDQRIYTCIKTNNISETKGICRTAISSDINQLLPWICDFELMVEGRYDEKHLLEALTKKINEKSIYVFEINGEVVSMAARSRSLLKTESVSLVYTPKEQRNHGYASQIVKYITDLILEEGRTAMLYTDLSNPTSNSIYMNIGYITYCDSSVYVKPI